MDGITNYRDVIAITMHECDLEFSSSDESGSEWDHDSEWLWIAWKWVDLFMSKFSA